MQRLSENNPQKNLFFQKIKASFPFIFLIFFACAFMGRFFGKVLAYPGHYVFSAGGDGLKNYFTFIWSIKYEKGYWFSGMNYPYGEHALYTDNSFILVVLLRWVNDHIMPIGDNEIGIMNIFVLLLFFLGFFIVYFLLRRFNIGKWAAVWGAIAIECLSPYTLRMNGHFALAAFVFIPVVFHFILSFRRKPGNVLPEIGYILFVSIFGLLHLYHALMGVMILLMWILSELIVDKKSFFLHWVRWVRKAIVALIPLISLFVFVKLTDPVKDRPDTPIGILYYSSRVKGFLFPYEGIINTAWEKVLNKSHIVEEFEAANYLGFAVIVLLLGLIAGKIVRTGRFKDRFKPISRNKDIRVFWWLGILLAIFSFGTIYQLGLLYLMDALPPLKQFRSLGRFGWPVYYCAAIVGLYYFEHSRRLLKIKKLSALSAGIAILLFFGWIWEGWLHIAELSPRFEQSNDFMSDVVYTELRTKLKESGHNPAEFQALFPLPIGVIGSEKIMTNGQWMSYQEAVKWSLATGIPQLNIAMSRTSISQSLSMLQLLSHKILRRERYKDFDQRPFLMLKTQDAVLPGDQWLFDSATKILDYKDMSLYSLPVSALKENPASYYLDSIGSIANPVLFMPLDESREAEGLDHKGVFYKKDGDHILWEGVFGKAAQDKDLIASIWLYVHPHTAGMPWFFIEKEKNGGKEKDILQPEYFQLRDVYKGWVRADIRFKPGTESYKIKIKYDDIIIADHLLIQGVSDTILQNSDQMRWWNNYPVEK